MAKEKHVDVEIELLGVPCPECGWRVFLRRGQLTRLHYPDPQDVWSATCPNDKSAV